MCTWSVQTLFSQHAFSIDPAPFSSTPTGRRTGPTATAFSVLFAEIPFAISSNPKEVNKIQMSNKTKSKAIQRTYMRIGTTCAYALCARASVYLH